MFKVYLKLQMYNYYLSYVLFIIITITCDLVICEKPNIIIIMADDMVRVIINLINIFNY